MPNLKELREAFKQIEGEVAYSTHIEYMKPALKLFLTLASHCIEHGLALTEEEVDELLIPYCIEIVADYASTETFRKFGSDMSDIVGKHRKKMSKALVKEQKEKLHDQAKDA